MHVKNLELNPQGNQSERGSSFLEAPSGPYGIQ